MALRGTVPCGATRMTPPRTVPYRAGSGAKERWGCAAGAQCCISHSGYRHWPTVHTTVPAAVLFSWPGFSNFSHAHDTHATTRPSLR